MKSITIIVDENGGIEVEAFGFKGKSCETATADYIKALGAPGASKKKPEYHAKEERKIKA